MKKPIILLLVLFAIITSCKKDSNKSNTLTIQAANVTSGNYSFLITKTANGERIYGEDFKTQNATYYTEVTAGESIDVEVVTTGTVKLTYLFRGQTISGTTLNAAGRTKGTVHLPD